MKENTIWEKRIRFSDKTWERLRTALPSLKKSGRPSNTRNFLEAVFFRFRTGISWRDLPADFGPWKTVFNRFNRWSKLGHFLTVFDAVKKNQWRSFPLD